MNSSVRFVVLAACLVPAVSPASDLVALLPDDYAAAQARVDLIQQATRQIEASYYWIGNDALAAMFLSLLREAAQRQVSVRLIVDAEHDDIPSEVQTLLLQSGVRIKEFHPVSPAHPKWVNLRMHDKVLIVDCKQMIVGSRNLRDSHFGRAKVNYVDRDAYVAGDVVAQAGRYFDCLWTSPEVRDTAANDKLWQRLKQKDKLSLDRVGLSKASGRGLSPAAKAALWLNAGRRVSVCCRPIDFCACNDWSACAVEVCCVQFIYDPCGQKGNPGGTDEQLLALIRQAQSTIVLETPYFVMSVRLKQALFEARSRGVGVVILTNSLASTDHTFVAAVMTNQRRRTLRNGIELWEYAGPNHLHAKSLVVDGTTAFVGSFNFDPRSEFLNTETGVVVSDPQVAEWVQASIDDHMQNAFRVGRHGRSVAHGIRNPGAPAANVLLLQPARVVAPFVRRSL
ncbi:MAG TPA: phosphatidylserine/phosphatidylglycerophosphate/cardiolipin synthase family protein [Pirellulales bacterium]|nr:phosphatidylserine/phosphatidylglycerophosphate/cardiolipin synthase family protein [Pirellulales bacterium]